MIPVYKTNDPLSPPVTVAELAQFMRADPADPLLSGFLVSATESVISFIKRDLKTRTWVMSYWDWPFSGPNTCHQITKDYNKARETLKLLMATNGEQTIVSEVLISGEAQTTDAYTVENDYISFDNISYKDSSDVKALQITYSTGYGATDADVPEAIKESIKLTALFMYDSRGCSAEDALNKSGAAAVLAPYRAAEALL